MNAKHNHERIRIAPQYVRADQSIVRAAPCDARGTTGAACGGAAFRHGRRLWGWVLEVGRIGRELPCMTKL